jgi:hypothetical protein
MNAQQQEQQQFPRYTNEESNQFMIQTLCNLLKDTTTTNSSIERKDFIKKILNLCLAREHETESSSYHRGYDRYKNDENTDVIISSHIDSYHTYSITQTIIGSFDTLEEIPEEFRSKATKRETYDYTSYNYSYSSYSRTKNVKIRWNIHEFSDKEFNVSKEVADSYCDKVIDRLSYSYNKTKSTDWNAICNDIISGKLDISSDLDQLNTDTRTETDNSSHRFSQFGKGRFHPAPNVSDFLTNERRSHLSTLCIDMGIYFPSNDVDKVSFVQLHQAIEELEKRLGVTDFSFVVDRKRSKTLKESTDMPRYNWRRPEPVKKDTFKCIYGKTLLTDEEKSSISELRKLPFKYRSKKGYNDAVKLLSIMRGRLHNVFNPTMQANGLVMDKTGLSFFSDKPTDPVTCGFLRLILSSFSAQKLFTIESQMHGGLDRWLKAILDLLIEENAPFTQFEHIFMLIPSERTINFVSKDKLELIYSNCLDQMKLMSVFFSKQWELGVKDCAKNMMMVPRSGTTSIHVNAWNACAGAWGNLLRFIRIIGSKLEYQPLQLFKVLKLTAGDQMQWAEGCDKGADPDCSIFLTLTLSGLMPYSGLNSTSLTTSEFTKIVTDACNQFKIEPRKWLGGPIERSAETKGDIISVCGVVISPELVDIAKDTGAFGSKPYIAT